MSKIDTKVSEMMLTPMNKLPDLAVEYMKYMASRLGFCGEVCVTAYYHYCQSVMQMKCEDEAYKITPEGEKWFLDQPKRRGEKVGIQTGIL